MKGNYLKHIKYLFIADINYKKAISFVRYIIQQINMTPVHIKAIRLDPGFEIFCVLKESYLSFSYWGEVGLCIMDIFSCKNFTNELVTEHIKSILNANKVIEKEILNSTVLEEVAKLV